MPLAAPAPVPDAGTLRRSGPPDRFRLAAAYDVVLPRDLAARERAALGELVMDPEVAALLRPRVEGATWKAVGPEVLHLLTSFTPTGSSGQVQDTTLLERLLVDGVVERNGENGWESGPAALRRAHTDLPDLEEGPSRDAVVHADGLAAAGRTDPQALARSLYLYGSLPATRRWRLLLPDAESVVGWLGVHGRDVREALGGWRHSRDEHWLRWSTGVAAPSLTKVYVCAPPEALPEVFRSVVTTLGEVSPSACAVKIGAGVHGVLRPDRLVLHGLSPVHVDRLVDGLTAGAPGVRPTPLPFTAGVRPGCDLVRGGVDPASRPGSPLSLLAPSWRSHIAALAARAVADPGRGSGIAATMRVAILLRANGIDPRTWVPTADTPWP